MPRKAAKPKSPPKPRKAAKPPDPRHTQVKELLAKYWAAKNPETPDLPWGPAEAGALGQFLTSNPTLTIEQITTLLRNRYQSDDHAPGEPVFMWIKYLTRYSSGPLDKFKQPKRRPDAQPQPSRADLERQRLTGAGPTPAQHPGVQRVVEGRAYPTRPVPGPKPVDGHGGRPRLSDGC